MTAVLDCWHLYAKHHLPTIVTGNHAKLLWKAQLRWWNTVSAERITDKEVDLYIASRKGVTFATINRELTVLRAALRFAELHRLIDRAPYIKSLPVPPTKVRALTIEEARSLIKVADKYGNWRDRVYMRLALGTGARPGAICELKWDQIDKEIIDYRRHDDLSSRRKRRSVVPINKMVHKALEIAEANRRGNAYVLHWQGRKLESPKELVKRIARKARIEKCTPHVLRHTVASLLLQDGVDLLKVSRLLGHASSRITEQVYFQAPPTWLKDTTERLDF
jgi:integrase